MVVDTISADRIAEMLHNNKVSSESIIHSLEQGIEYQRIMLDTNRLAGVKDFDSLGTGYLKVQKEISDAELLISLLRLAD